MNHMPSWPEATLNAAALAHNITLMAEACREHGVAHAPHVKTTMSRELFAMQREAGAWGATVATPRQLRTVHGWGVRRLFLANELMDPREVDWLRCALTESPGLQVLLYVDSLQGVTLLEHGFTGASQDVKDRLGVLIEVGTPQGRTGVRRAEDVLLLGSALRDAGLGLSGVAGYEGSVTHGFAQPALQAVRVFCEELRSHAQALVSQDLVTAEAVVVSAGGSAYLDVVLPSLGGDLKNADGSPRTVLPIVRSGAYLTHDHGLLARANPWARMTPPRHPVAAATVWAQVLSTPEEGLALVGAGRRDVPYDIDLPTPILVRRALPDGTAGPSQPLLGLEVRKVDDQHLYVVPTDGATLDLVPGDVVGLGISHPCTLFDKWRTITVTDAGATRFIHTEF